MEQQSLALCSVIRLPSLLTSVPGSVPPYAVNTTYDSEQKSPPEKKRRRRVVKGRQPKLIEMSFRLGRVAARLKKAYKLKQAAWQAEQEAALKAENENEDGEDDMEIKEKPVETEEPAAPAAQIEPAAPEKPLTQLQIMKNMVEETPFKHFGWEAVFRGLSLHRCVTAQLLKIYHPRDFPEAPDQEEATQFWISLFEKDKVHGDFGIMFQFTPYVMPECLKKISIWDHEYREEHRW